MLAAWYLCTGCFLMGHQVGAWEGGVASQWHWEVEMTVSVRVVCAHGGSRENPGGPSREGWTGVSHDLCNSQNQETGLRPCRRWRQTQAGPTAEGNRREGLEGGPEDSLHQMKGKQYLRAKSASFSTLGFV